MESPEAPSDVSLRRAGLFVRALFTLAEAGHSGLEVAERFRMAVPFLSPQERAELHAYLRVLLQELEESLAGDARP